MNVQAFLTGLLTLLTAALLALAPAGARPASGGYQLFEPLALADQNAIQLAALENFDYHAKIAPECCNATNTTPIQITKARFGHTFSTHGENATNFLTQRARGSGQAQGQFLDDQGAAKFIQNNLDKVKGGAVSLPVPEGLSVRIINPDGSFSPARTIRLVPGGNGVKTAYPEP